MSFRCRGCTAPARRLRAALLDPDGHPGADDRELAKLLLRKAGRGGIPLDLTLDLVREGKRSAAQITVRGWSDADLLAMLRRAAEDDPSEWVRLSFAEIAREYEE